MCKPDHVPPLAKTLLWFPAHSEQQPNSYNAPQALCDLPSLPPHHPSLLSPTLSPADSSPATLASLLLLIYRTQRGLGTFARAVGSAPLPGTRLFQVLLVYFLILFTYLLKCHLATEACPPYLTP